MPTLKEKFVVVLNKPGQAVAPTFSPADIENGLVWLDASDSDTLFQDDAGTTPADTDAHVVGRWENKFADQYHFTQATTANKPLLKLAIQNSLPVIRFDGVNDYMTNAFGSTITQPISVAMVFNHKANTNSYVFDGIDTNRVALFDSSANHSVFAGVSLNYAQTLPTGFNQLVIEYNSANSFARKNGTEVASGNAGAIGVAGFTLASRFSLLAYANLDLCEFIVKDGQFTAPELSNIETYLTDKWGL